MLGSLKSDLGVLETAMNLRVQRQQVIASNIANADTPYFKAKDFDFSASLRAAVGNRMSNTGIELAKTSAGHIDGSSGSGKGLAALKFRTEKQSAVDGNTVDMDVERAAMAENSMQYEVLTRLISDKISRMRQAVASSQG